MLLVSLLKRRDASSVLVAIVVAMVLAQFLQTVTSDFAVKLSGLADGQYHSYGMAGAGWATQYLYPFIWAVFQLLLLEIVIRFYVWAHALLTKK